MDSADANELAAHALAAELNAALAARHASLDFERRFLSLDRREEAGRELFDVRIAEARAKDAAKAPLAHLDVLAPLALNAAASLEEAAAALFQYLGREVPMTPQACLRAVRALQRLARIDEARTRAVFTAAREGRTLPGFDDAVDLVVESEQLFLALRRFEALLERGGDWEAHDVDWLLWRCTSLPGRLRLRAAALRILVLELGEGGLTPEQDEATQPFARLELGPGKALAWLAAGFSPEECMDWRSAGLKNPAQAHAWHCHGFGPAEAVAWSKADLLPDESGIFVECGATEIPTALALRQQLGDVERYFGWYRAGFKMDEALRWLQQGVRSPEEAVKKRRFEALNKLTAAAQADVSQAKPAPLPGLGAPGAAAPAAVAATAIAPKPAVPAGPVILHETPKAMEESFAQRRARERFGIAAPGEAEGWAATPPEGGAWIGWGLADPAAPAARAANTQHGASVPLGSGLFDLVLVTEGVALPGRSLKLTSFEPDPAWQERLRGLRSLRGIPTTPGDWHLFAWPPCRALLLWGSVWPGPKAPWSDAVDFEADEAWRKRWARKTDEWGESGVKALCEAGRLSDGAWWVGHVEGLIRAEGKEPQAIKAPWPSAAWREAFEDFCLKMEIPRQAPHWHLVAEKA